MGGTVHAVTSRQVVYAGSVPLLLRCNQAAYSPPCFGSLDTLKALLAHLLNVLVLDCVSHYLRLTLLYRVTAVQCTVHADFFHQQRSAKHSTGAQCPGVPLVLSLLDIMQQQCAALDNIREGRKVAKTMQRAKSSLCVCMCVSMVEGKMVEYSFTSR